MPPRSRSRGWREGRVPSWRREPGRLAGRWEAFRHGAPGVPPVWRRRSTIDPYEQPSARWHSEGDGVCQYLALDEATAWAEHIVHAGIESDLDRRDHPRRLWRFWAEEHDIADLQSGKHFADCGLPSMWDDAGYGRCQALARELRSAGFRGLISPSAALPGGICLSLFGERYDIEPGPHTADSRERTTPPDSDRFVVVTMVADEALVPPGVLFERGVPGWWLQGAPGSERRVSVTVPLT